MRSNSFLLTSGRSVTKSVSTTLVSYDERGDVAFYGHTFMQPAVLLHVYTISRQKQFREVGLSVLTTGRATR